MMLDKFLWRKALTQKGLLIATIVFGVLVAGVILLQAYVLAEIVDDVFLKALSLADVSVKLFFLLGIIIARAIFSFGEEWLALRLAWQIEGDLREGILNKIAQLGPVKMTQEATGVVVNLLGEGLGQLEDYFSRYLPQLFKAAIVPILFLAVIFPIDWLSGVILLVTAPLVPFFMILIGKWTENVSRRQWGMLSALSGYLADVLAGIKTLKLLNRAQKQGEKIAQISDSFRKVTLSVLRWAFLSALALELLTTLSIAIISVGLGIRLVEGMIDFRRAFFLLLLAPDFYLPLRTLGSYFHTSLNAKEAVSDLAAFLAKPSMAAEGNENVEGELSICLNNVSVRHQGQQESALSEITLTINPKEKIGLVGPSGSGKSTLLNLLCGFLEPVSGEVTVNGIDSSALNWSNFRSKVALISQKPYLFTGTIGENIMLGNDLATLADARRVARLIGLDAHLREMPLGIDTLIGQGGEKLSGGQQQLVVMARALLKNSQLIFMDEATANLDILTEDYLTKALALLLKDKGAVIAAHRLSTIKAMDKIIVLDKGRVAATGTHEELLQKCGLYRQMVCGRDADV